MKPKLRHDEVVDCVLNYLENNKQTAIERMFPDVTFEYKQEWMCRGPYSFWSHLDTQNRIRLTDMAVEHYHK